MNNRHLRAAVTAAALASLPGAAAAQGQVKVDVSADIRLRLEQDWDSRTATGAPRLDRARARIRARLNAKLDLGNGVAVASRARTGGDGSQQNANLTVHDFDGNPEDTFNVTIDRYSLAWKGKSAGAEIGRMAFPFFTPNEYFWDGDISPLGVAGNIAVPIGGKAKLKLNAGAFRLPVDLAHYSGSLIAGQAVVEAGGATLAAGLFRFDADRTDVDRLKLLDGNGGRDYTVLALNAQYKLPAGGRPLALGVDFYRNLQRYSAPNDAVSLANRDERTGFVGSIAWGDTAKKGAFQVGYRYFRMEKLAVNASYAHDDVARFGTAAQAALTDLKGHDIYVNYAATKELVIGVRTMSVERITNREHGKRIRLDIAYSF